MADPIELGGGTGAVIPLEARNIPKVSLPHLSVKIVSVVREHPQDDCEMVLCEYPTGFQKAHQLFDKAPVDELLRFMVQQFRGHYGTLVVPVTALPDRAHLAGFVVTFKEGA
jgi:hypothetical protein